MPFTPRLAENGKAEIKWVPTIDELEETAVPEGFILYTRKDDGGFDNGKIIKDFKKSEGIYTTTVSIKPGLF